MAESRQRDAYDVEARLGLNVAHAGSTVHNHGAHDEVHLSGGGDVVHWLPGMATMSAKAPGLSTPMSSRAISSAATEMAARTASNGLQPGVHHGLEASDTMAEGKHSAVASTAPLALLEATHRWALVIC